MEVYTPAAKVTPKGLCVDTADNARVGANELFQVVGKTATTSSAVYSRRIDFSSTRTPAGMYRAEPSSLRSTSRHLGYFLLRTTSSHWGIEARAIWMKKPA